MRAGRAGHKEPRCDASYMYPSGFRSQNSNFRQLFVWEGELHHDPRFDFQRAEHGRVRLDPEVRLMNRNLRELPRIVLARRESEAALRAVKRELSVDAVTFSVGLDLRRRKSDVRILRGRQ